jgi:hypothetical protein
MTGDHKRGFAGMNRGGQVREFRVRPVVWDAMLSLFLLSKRQGTKGWNTVDYASEVFEVWVVDGVQRVFGLTLTEYAKRREAGATFKDLIAGLEAGREGMALHG